jgi:hypothetical protein
MSGSPTKINLTQETQQLQCEEKLSVLDCCLDMPSSGKLLTNVIPPAEGKGKKNILQDPVPFGGNTASFNQSSNSCFINHVQGCYTGSNASVASLPQMKADRKILMQRKQLIPSSMRTNLTKHRSLALENVFQE